MRKYYLSATGVLAGFATSLLVIAPTVFIGAFFTISLMPLTLNR